MASIDVNGYVQNEGNVEARDFPAYPVSYRSIVPRKSESTNLLVPVCISASHIAFGSLRMEPVFMILFGILYLLINSPVTLNFFYIVDNIFCFIT